jgi:Fe-S-cluster-containing dehydrogenase component
MNMTKALVVNMDKCIACQNCVVACKDEFVDNDWSPYSKPQGAKQFWMRLDRQERGDWPKLKVSHMAVPCVQCEDPPCQKAATGGAIYKRPDGIVIIDPVKSVGQKQLVASCPYGAIYWNQDLNIPQKCTFCAHLVDRGWQEMPRCVKACPTEALTFGEYDSLKSTIDSSKAVPLNADLGTKPRVYYIGLPKTFIAGTLIDQKSGDCLKGASVTVKDTASGVTFTTASDFLGEFMVDGLDAKKSYDVTISKPGGAPYTKTVSLNTDTYLGEITL